MTDTVTRTARSLAAEAAFRARLSELGAELVEPAWLGVDRPHRVRCAAGHDCTPMPGHVNAGHGPCKRCRAITTNAPRAAAAASAFLEQLDALGAELLEPYRGANSPHRVRCAAGHDCQPRPANVISGRQGICQICAGNDKGRMEARFRARLGELGAVLLEAGYLGNVPHRVQCAFGHITTPTPGSYLRPSSSGCCRKCADVAGARRRTGTTEIRFRELLAAADAELLEPYRGRHYPVLVRCAAGHQVTSNPGSIFGGVGICRICSGFDPATAEAAFRERLAQFGAVMLGEYQNVMTPVLVRCAAGHECLPRPNGVQQGQGICRHCAGKEWDTFYIVSADAAGRIKFGISSHGGYTRLRDHRAAGYRTVLRLMTDLPGTTAPDIERAVIAALRLAGAEPVRGREYYDADALALVLDVADNYLINAAA